MALIANKRIFTTGEFYHVVCEAVGGMKDMRQAKRKGLIDHELQNHIMLVVTEVNGCALCSYVHTKDALEMGMSEEDIQAILSGSINHLDPKESVALFFAQHYAETKGQYSSAAWKRVVDTYGLEKAKGILGVTKVIMMGNAQGIAFGTLKNRLKGKPDKKSSLCKELGVIFSTIIFLPVALLKTAFKKQQN
ncbi:carboxymuconolactone decarboxylase family protein [Clostridia bacterium]|nr:carboxymuconolactone decarboxylase family protein [Clostridia bacterium]